MRILMLMFLLLLPLPSIAEDTYTIYNKDWRVEGYWKDKGDVIEKYNKNWRRDGYIRKETGEKFDEKWRRRGLTKEEFYNRKEDRDGQ